MLVWYLDVGGGRGACREPTQTQTGHVNSTQKGLSRNLTGNHIAVRHVHVRRKTTQCNLCETMFHFCCTSILISVSENIIHSDNTEKGGGVCVGGGTWLDLTENPRSLQGSDESHTLTTPWRSRCFIILSSSMRVYFPQHEHVSRITERSDWRLLRIKTVKECNKSTLGSTEFFLHNDADQVSNLHVHLFDCLYPCAHLAAFPLFSHAVSLTQRALWHFKRSFGCLSDHK